MQEEQLTELKAAQASNSELAEKQQTVIGNLESVVSEQKKVLAEMTDELTELTRKEKDARDRAE